MQKAQKSGFSTVEIILVIVVIVVLGGVFLYWRNAQWLSGCPKIAETCPDGSSVGYVWPTCKLAECPGGRESEAETVDTSTWKTYRNEKYGFEVRYPGDLDVKENIGFKNSWQLLMDNNSVLNFIIYDDRSSESLLECATPERPAIDCQRGSFIANGVTYDILNYKSFDESGGFLGYAIITVGERDGKTVSAYAHLGIDQITRDKKQQELNKIFSTFKFIKNSAEIKQPSADLLIPPLSLPTTCIDEQEGVPVITFLSSYSGLVGTKLEIKGCNFSGFEGDKNVWIENSQSVAGLLYGEAGSTSKLLKITLKSPLCQSDNSYSGLPCSAWLTLVPGTYKIYTMPWGKKSNEAVFTIKGEVR